MGAIERILCATDFSPASGPPWAFAQRLRRATGARLVLLHVVPAGPVTEDEQRRTLGVLERFVEFAVDWEAGVAVRVEEGDAAAGILAVAEKESADLVVVGTHGRTGLDRLVLGSVAEDVVRASPCPVVTVRPLPHVVDDASRPLRRLLHAGDRSIAPGGAWPWAKALAEATGADLGECDAVADAEEIVHHAGASGAELVIIGTGPVLGAMTRRVLHASPCPVMTVGPRVRVPVVRPP